MKCGVCENAPERHICNCFNLFRLVSVLIWFSRKKAAKEKKILSKFEVSAVNNS